MSFQKKKSIINWIIASIFIGFAVIQWNDPDPIMWICLYGAMALMIILKQMEYQVKMIFAIFALAFLAYGLYLFPSLMKWIQSGMPSLAGEMKAETPEIEDMRELGGVVILFVTALVYWLRWK